MTQKMFEMFVDYVKKHKYLWLWAVIFTFICHGSMMLGNSVGIDTEEIITAKDSLYNGWLATGRHGLVALKWLSDSLVFFPLFAGVGTLAFTVAACILWCFLFHYVSGKDNLGGTVTFIGILVSHTILTEQYYFKLQSMEVAFSFALMAVCLLLSHQFAIKKKKRLLFGVFPMMLLLFSVYQVFNALYIMGAVVCFLLHYFFIVTKADAEENKAAAKALWMYILRFAGVFLIGFLANQLITKLFFTTTEYLSNQIYWGKDTFEECVKNIFGNVLQVALGSNIFYTKTFSLYVLLICAGAACTLKHTRTKGKVLGILSVLLLFMTPFYMTLLCGGPTVHRAELVMPYTVAFMGYVVFLFGEKLNKGKKLVQVLAVCLGIMTVYTQTRYTLALNYTDRVRYDSDVRVAVSLINDIMAVQNADCSYPVVFIGAHEAELNASCIYGDCIGRSIFAWDTDVEPYGYHNSKRIIGFMGTMGVDFVRATIEETAVAYQYSSSMEACWPAEGSIQLTDDIIVVKLSKQLAKSPQSADCSNLRFKHLLL